MDILRGTKPKEGTKYTVAFARFGKVVVEASTAKDALARATLALEDFHLGTPIVVACTTLATPGTKVKVVSGDSRTDLGQGTYIGEADIYLLRDKNGSVFIPDQPEHPISEETLVRNRLTLSKVEQTPKIRLDSGETVYGCQVWWAPVEESLEEEDPEDILQDEKAN